MNPRRGRPRARIGENHSGVSALTGGPRGLQLPSCRAGPVLLTAPEHDGLAARGSPSLLRALRSLVPRNRSPAQRVPVPSGAETKSAQPKSCTLSFLFVWRCGGVPERRAFSPFAQGEPLAYLSDRAIESVEATLDAVEPRFENSAERFAVGGAHRATDGADHGHAPESTSQSMW